MIHIIFSHEILNAFPQRQAQGKVVRSHGNYSTSLEVLASAVMQENK